MFLDSFFYLGVLVTGNLYRLNLFEFESHVPTKIKNYIINLKKKEL